MQKRFVSVVSTCLVIVLYCSVVSCGSTKERPETPEDARTSAEDAQVECSENAQCNDGLYCNGEETCSDTGQCVSGQSIACSDGIACTVDTCSNATMKCVSLPPDDDGDGHGDAACIDADSKPLGDDCDDSDANRFPGNVEFCDTDNHDEDCNDETFGNVDVDVDGIPSAKCCNKGLGDVMNCGSDCDDTRANVKPGVTEACDGLDNDCNGIIDDGVTVAGFTDSDGDGYGDSTSPVNQCAGLPHFSTLGGDCADDDATRNPGQVEICDMKDNNCDGAGLAGSDLVDENAQVVFWYVDTDGDGFGDPNIDGLPSCEPLSGRSMLKTDCNDQNAGINPAAAEVCDGIDNDCNGLADFRIGINDFEDDDGDGLVDIACNLGTDCDDSNPATGVGAIEICDGQDNDCDGDVDEDVANTVWYRDLDNDGFGSLLSGTVITCEGPLGFSSRGGDCHDGKVTVNPDGTEVCNGEDDDCDGSIDEKLPTDACPDNGSASGFCVAGSCILCEEGYIDLDNQAGNGCEIDTQTNPNHCGGSGNACVLQNALTECRDGECLKIFCLPGWDDCNGDAANENSDGCEASLSSPENCGTCNTDCSTLENTLEAQCNTDRPDKGYCEIITCDNDAFLCGAGNEQECVRLADDPENCGFCNQRCSATPNRSGQCIAGQCPCEEGFVECNGQCIAEANFVSDSSNCGSCNRQCGQFGESGICTGGTCECQGGAAQCDGQCNNNYDNDPLNCGGCTSNNGAGTNCNQAVTDENGQGRCDQGVCRADCQSQPDLYQNCDGDLDCEDLQNDSENCGGCSRRCADVVNTSGVCARGECQCANGFTLCDGQCVDLNSDINYCGSCSQRCNEQIAGASQCNSGQCEAVCDSFTGQANCDANPTDCETSITSVENCGGCDIVCPDIVDGFATCENQGGAGWQCGGNCSAGFQACDSVCVDLQLDNDNCGSCGNSCGIGGECGAGASCDSLVEMAVGEGFSCVRRSSGSVVCWGDNGSGQLGNGGTGTSATPVVVESAAMGQVLKIAAGAKHMCAITTTSTYCWGDNSSMQLATPGPNATTPSLINMNFREIAAGRSHTCGIDNSNNVFCWGDRSFGQTGDGTTGETNASAIPTQISSSGLDGDASKIYAGDDFSCAVSFSGVMYCWGSGGLGQLGIGSTMDSGFPAMVATSTVQDIALGSETACIVTNTGSMECWGDNNDDQIGNAFIGGGAFSVNPVNIGLNGLLSASAGDSHTCAVNTFDTLYCWGGNNAGQVGIGSTNSTVASAAAISLPNVRFVGKGASAKHTCAITLNNEVYCWGENTQQQVGISNGGMPVLSPEMVSGL